MLRNMLVAVGLALVAKAAREQYRQHRALKAEQAKWQASSRSMT